MKKRSSKKPEITENIQLGCMWKLMGIFDTRLVHRSQKLLSNAKQEIKHVPGKSSKSRDDIIITSFDKNLESIRRGSGNKFQGVGTDKKNVKQLAEENGANHKSRQFMDALEILDSNSELFLKLLQDPNSLLVKHIKNAEDSQAEKELAKSLVENKIIEPKKCQKSVLEKFKSQYGCSSQGNEPHCPSQPIVVLKPRQKCMTSQQHPRPSLTRKEHIRDNLGMHKDLDSRTRPEIDVISERVSDNMRVSASSYSDRREYDILLEAKRRLSKRLKNVDKGESSLANQEPRTLRRILSSPEHEFLATFSPKRDKDLASVSSQMILPSENNFQLDCHNGFRHHKEEGLPTTSYKAHADQVQILDDRPNILENVSFTTDDLSSNAYVKIKEVNEAMESGYLNLLKMPSGQNNIFFTNAEHITNTRKLCDENRLLACSIQDQALENQALKSSLYAKDFTTDKEDNLSPVSVLEPLFTKDTSSTIAQLAAEPPIDPRRIDFDQNDSKMNLSTCIRKVLQASGLNWDELSRKARSSEQLFNLSLYDDHYNLLSDFINEILLEVNEHNSECRISSSSWGSIIRQDFQTFSIQGKNVVDEVMKEVNWYVVPLVMPRTLDQNVGRDVKKSGSWNGRQLDIEDVVIEVVDEVLFECIEEIIFVIQK